MKTIFGTYSVVCSSVSLVFWLALPRSTQDEFRDEVLSFNFDKFPEEDLEANAAATKGGSCSACLTASMSPRRLAGGGECNLGGRGGGGE